MKYLVIILLFSTTCFAQVQETIIRNNSGTVVGRIQTNNNQSMIYDGNGNYLGMVEGDAGVVVSTYFPKSNIVSGAVVLPSGLQPLDYLIQAQQNSYSNRAPVNISTVMQPKDTPLPATGKIKNVPHPEYLSVSNSQKNKIIRTEKRMRSNGISEDIILEKKIEMLNDFMVKRNIGPVMRKSRISDMKKYHLKAKALN